MPEMEVKEQIEKLVEDGKKKISQLDKLQPGSKKWMEASKEYQSILAKLQELRGQNGG